MDIKQLSYFVSVADARGFARAGSKLRMSQPALSRQVHALESELGTPLFVRHGRGVSLTEAGAVLRQRADELLQHIQTVKCEVSAMSLNPSGELKVGLPAAFRDLVAPEVIGTFSAKYPNVSLSITELTSVAREDAVAGGSVDLAVVTAMDTALVSHPLISESLFLVGAPDAGLHPGRPVDLDRVAQLSVVQNTLPNGVRRVLERAMARRGLALRTVLEVDSLPVLINLAAMGRHYACVPYSAIHEDLAKGRVSAAPVAGVRITWKILNAPSRPLPLAGGIFEKLLRGECLRLTRARLWKTGKVIDDAARPSSRTAPAPAQG